MTQEAQPDTQSVLTPEVKAMIGVAGDLGWVAGRDRRLREYSDQHAVAVAVGRSPLAVGRLPWAVGRLP